MRRYLVTGLVLAAAASAVVFGTLALWGDEQARSDDPVVIETAETRIYDGLGDFVWPCQRAPYKPCPSGDITTTTIYPRVEIRVER